MSEEEIERRRLFWVWCDMRYRCDNPRHRQFADYGGRGIKVCERWQSFENFHSDMAPRPLGMTLDRIDNNGDYGPRNCRWANRKQQNSNRRNCIYVQCGTDIVTLKEYCRRNGLSYRPIVKRIRDRNWPIEWALTVPIGDRKAIHSLRTRHE